MEYVNVQSSYEKQAASRSHSGAGVTMLSIDKTPGSSQLPNNRRQAQKSPAKRVIQSATSSACSRQSGIQLLDTRGGYFTNCMVTASHTECAINGVSVSTTLFFVCRK